jgi:TolA-binding protein
MKLRQYRDAAADLKDFAAKFPDSPLRTEAGYQSGVANAGIPNGAAAQSMFEQVIRDQPGDVFADRSRLRIAELKIGQKQYGSAIDTLNAVMNRRSDDIAADALLMIGDVYLAQRKYREALQAYHDVIQQYTDFPLKVELGRYGLGQTYEKMNDHKQARLAYEEIVKSPVDPEMKSSAEQRLKKLKR